MIKSQKMNEEIKVRKSNKQSSNQLKDKIKDEAFLLLRKTVIRGISYGFLGDFLLILKGQLYFLLGLLSFLVGHAFYIYAFILKIRDFQSLPILYGVLFVNYLLYFPAYYIIFHKIEKEIIKKNGISKEQYDCVIQIISHRMKTK